MYHKANFALIGYDRGHIHMVSLGNELNNWRFTLGRIAFDMEILVINTCYH